MINIRLSFQLAKYFVILTSYIHFTQNYFKDQKSKMWSAIVAPKFLRPVKVLLLLLCCCCCCCISEFVKVLLTPHPKKHRTNRAAILKLRVYIQHEY